MITTHNWKPRKSNNNVNKLTSHADINLCWQNHTADHNVSYLVLQTYQKLSIYYHVHQPETLQRH